MYVNFEFILLRFLRVISESGTGFNPSTFMQQGRLQE